MVDNSKELRFKLNELLSWWPKGAVIPFSLLKEKGYSKQLLDKYKSSQWLASVGKGAYKLFHDKIEWFGGLYGLQAAGLAIHIGGKTALELQGLAHYLAPKMPRCFLFGVAGLRLPKWFLDYDWEIEVIYHTTHLFPEHLDSGLTDYFHRELTVRISAPERAALEMMYHIPSKQGFDEAFRIMENLTTLRPEVVQELLQNCRFVKVKRLFMYMAEKAVHSWIDELLPERIDFGSGKRRIIKNGNLDKKYLITVASESSY